MGLLNKVKNLFFEEEYVEVEEKPKKTKKDVPIAKKIELPKVEKVEPKEEEIEEVETLEEEIKEKRENKFPMHFDTEDFKEDQDSNNDNPTNEDEEFYLEQSVSRRSERYKEPVVEKEQPKESEEVIEEVEEEEKYDFELEYGKEQEEQKSLYEGKNPKKTFTPTPIISPIYGILDKNYTKDDVVTKKEIRLSTAHRKADLDAVREKAYGDLTSDITQSMEDVVEDKDTEEEKLDNTFYDLNDEDTSPAIESVTVGDAEEYFNDLGLEYNIDYEDTSVTKPKEKETKEKKRRSEKEEVEEKTEKEEQPEKEEQDEDLESNLFDLIESMYDEKE